MDLDSVCNSCLEQESGLVVDTEVSDKTVAVDAHKPSSHPATSISFLFYRVVVAQRVGRRTFDQVVAGSTPGRGVIKSHRSTQPSIHPG